MKFDVVSDSIDHISREAIQNSATSLIPKNSVLMVVRSGILARTVPIAITGRDLTINQDLKALCPNGAINPRFLYHLLESKMDVLLSMVSRGATVHRLMTEHIRALPFVLPPLPEQQRMVGILDEAFDAIAKAKANVEKNFQNARALLESHLQSVFTQRGPGWMDTVLGNLCGFVRGPFGGSLKKSMFVDKGYAVYEQQHAIYNQFEEVRYFIDEAKFKEMRRFELYPGDLIMSCSGTMGRVAIVPNDIRRGIINQALLKLTPTGKIFNRFLKAWMESEAFQDALKDYSGGAAIQNVASVKTLKEIKVPLPELSEQKRLVDEVDGLSVEIKRLEAIYQRKLAVLEELKKSLLHQAFSGQLTAGQSVMVSFPTCLSNITTTDLHAGVLAMAYQLHEQNGKLKHFTHVKAEKIAHMVEARLGINLGRAPVKDAAGPNDFPHLHKVEHRARKANYFDFKQVPGAAYKLQKLGGFDRLIERTSGALGDRREEVETLLQWMLSLTPKQAEIVATVFAAWNNLLLDGRLPSDEQIVYESREDWHPNKLKIERKKFFSAVQWLRQQGVVPEGKGRYVDKPRN
jgi:type I restriction enzyme S subunit